MPDLVDLDTAKRHINLTGSEADPDLELKLAQAEAIILEYLAKPSDEDWTATMASWTDETVPPVVAAAIVKQFAELWRFRGDDGVDIRKPGFLSEDIRALLGSRRQLVIA